jgi:hypothetical protein
VKQVRQATKVRQGRPVLYIRTETNKVKWDK